MCKADSRLALLCGALTRARGAFGKVSIEISRRIAKRNAALTIGCAAISFPLDALIDNNNIVGAGAEHPKRSV